MQQSAEGATLTAQRVRVWAQVGHAVQRFGLRLGATILAVGLVLPGCGGELQRSEDSASEAVAIPAFESLEQGLTSQEWPADALVATGSVQLDLRSTFTGNITVVNAGSVLLAHAAELALEIDASVTGSVRADTLFLGSGARINGAATYNSRTGTGTVVGATVSPLTLPVSVILPLLPTFSAGTQAVSLTNNEARTLAAGNFAAVTLAAGNGTGVTRLTLSGGTYAFASLSLATNARVECAAECEIRVVGRVTVDSRSYIGPAAVAGMGPGNVRLVVRGANAGGSPASVPAACSFANDATLAAWTLVPNGTLRLGQRVQLRGKFVVKDAVVGADSGGQGMELPILVQGPQGLTVTEHQSATFSASATGTGLRYQWQKNGVNVVGATSASLTLLDVPLSDDGAQFRVVISNSAGSITTSAATLHVLQRLVPRVTCVVPSRVDAGGAVTPGQVLFGYDNPAHQAMSIPVGLRNQASTSNGATVTPITQFGADNATHAWIAPLTAGGSATWTLEGVSAVATEGSPRCELPKPAPPDPTLPKAEHAGDYNPGLPAFAPYTFDGLQAYYSPDFNLSDIWRQQLGGPALLALAPPPGTPVRLPFKIAAQFDFDNHSWLDDGNQRDHLRVLISVNGVEKAASECERAMSCSSLVDLGDILPGEADPAQPELAKLDFTVQFRRCPLLDDCYWKTLGSVASMLNITTGETPTISSSSVPCDGTSCDFTADLPAERTVKVRYEDYDGFNDVFNITWVYAVTPPDPPPPTQQPAPGTPDGLCVQWNTSFVEDLLYTASPKYPAAFAEFAVTVKNVTGQVFELGQMPNSSAPRAFLDQHGCIPFLDSAQQPTDFFKALATPLNTSLPSIELRVATRFQKPAGAGVTDFEVHRLNAFRGVEDAAVESALVALEGTGKTSNLVLIYSTDNVAAGKLDGGGFHPDGDFLVPTSPWVLGPEANSTLHPLTNTAALASLALRTAGATQFRAGTSHHAEVGPGCFFNAFHVDLPRDAICITDADCVAAQPNGVTQPKCIGIDVNDGTSVVRTNMCGCTSSDQCLGGHTCAIRGAFANGTQLTQCTIQQGGACASSDEDFQPTLFIGPPSLPVGATGGCNAAQPCSSHQQCLKRTQSLRTPMSVIPDPVWVNDGASNANNPVVQLEPCPPEASAAECQCHLPDESRWKSVVAHELGHHIQGQVVPELASADYSFDCPAGSTCPGQGRDESDLLYDPPGAPAICRCDHVTEANKLHCLQSLERPAEAFGEGFGHFYAATLFNDANQVTPPAVDACTFVYYKSVMDEAGTVHPAPFPIACSAADKWRNRHCANTADNVVNPDQSTERDWLQFLWSWHVTSLHNDIGEMFDTLIAACKCWVDGQGQVACDGTCTSSQRLFWDWPASGESARSLREGVISRASGGFSSTQVDPFNFPEYRDFETLSNGRGVSRDTTP